MVVGFKYIRWQKALCRLLGIIGLAHLLTGCEPHSPQTLGGYIEGDYLYLSVREAGYLQELAIVRGQRVTQGQKLFQLNTDWQQLVLEEANARLKTAEYQLENLLQPHRQTELNELRAHLKAQQAKVQLADIELRQLKALRDKGFVAQIRLDEAQAIFVQAQAAVKATEEQLATFANTLGRNAEIQAAQSDVQAAQAVVAQRRWLNGQQTMWAPSDGEIYETYYQLQEWVPAGAVVASLLVDHQRHIRFFVPEPQRASIQIGQSIQAYCDGCPQPITAQIVFIASTTEYTPPVIFSQHRRSKLMFRVEAQPEKMASLPIGLPVDVQLNP